MTRQEVAKLIAEWCSAHGHSESTLLYSDPAHYVFTFELFDMLVEKGVATKEEIGRWFDAAQEKRGGT